ncbi:MAG: pantetheine-phosphate adenylyltransferase [Halothiobacillus sp. 24-54-40]|jgi:pantetheine-phosphate adenylyltransferase|nr:MAG: pantetheine-phosphate adenylyltransferase [Halothiobacillus sp. 35-54-62]OYZ87976.1 MAG: pantetheine-phosphate adenylyltransferase [Halothiobacillus sp. 24-54-40]OZA81406.1 MAG: pantetheine-phosphate adenylyltransferase [Halothiobacillus sp. 39-53-45]HQS02186.1 pantetheine-phosphate adenylyltransferase [Halothiobacillus sp.]HQS28996.1 pantetheine-phosphate adenylyltransferase [Halothiobacillus sp.]
MKRAIYPGTFDPITLGHIDVAHRATRMFDEVIIAVAAASSKTPLFDLAERTALAEQAVLDYPRIRVLSFGGLLVDFVHEQQACAIVRGLRAVSDFEFEIQMAAVNRRLAPDIETVFLSPTEDLGFVSSSIVRELARLHGTVATFVPEHVALALKARFKRA